MAFYPIISRYDINFEELTLGTPKTYTTKKEAIDFKEGKDITITRNYASYGVNYKYDRVGAEQFCLMTQFLKIATPLVNVKNHYYFCVDINENIKLKALITNVLDSLKIMILKEKPNLLPADIVLPITNKQMFGNPAREYLDITLIQFDKKIITPIHYHRTKKQGGQVITIKNKSTDEIFNELKKEMSLFARRSA